MNLVNPLGLLALLAIPPVILLYLLKLKRIAVRVPSVLLWRSYVQDMQASQPFQRLRFSILLLLQLLIITIASVALARPYVQLSRPAGRSVAVVLDASLSMQATDVSPSRFDAARAEAIRIARALDPSDEMMVLLAGGQTRVLASFTRDKQALEQALRSARASDCRSDLREALVLCVSLAREKQNTTVYVLSDGAGAGALDVTLPPGAEVYYVSFGESTRNTAITALNVRETYGRDTRYQLFVAARNFGTEEVVTQVEILKDGDLLNVETLRIPAGEQVQHIVDDPKLGAGVIEARLDVQDDLLADNVARVVFRERTRRRVLLVTEGNIWLERAFAVDPMVDCVVLAPEQYDPTAEDATAFDVTVFDRWAPPELLPINALLIRAAPANGPVEDLGAEFEEPSILDWDRKSPLLQYVDFGAVRIASMSRVSPRPWARGIVETAVGPLVVIGESEGKRSLYLGFELGKSNFPVRIAFPIFVRNAIQWLTTDPSGVEVQSSPTGSPVTLRLPPGVAEVSVVTPDGSQRTVAVRTPDAGEAGPPTLVFDDTERAGVYSFSANGEVLARVALNVSDPAESDITPSQTLDLGSGGEATRSSYVRSTREIWHWLLLAALVLMCAEWVVYHRRVG